MFTKFVKDRAHNKYPAYCCEDIDARLGLIEEQLAALVAGTVPDRAVTLAKLADDARTWAREINRGTLFAEWIGTYNEYEEHIADNGGEPLPNVRYTITDHTAVSVEELNAASAKIIDLNLSKTDTGLSINTALPIYQTGIYFLVVSWGSVLCSQSIVITDTNSATHSEKSYYNDNCEAWLKYSDGKITPYCTKGYELDFRIVSYTAIYL